MENLIHLLHMGGYSCVIMNKAEVRTFKRRGVADLYDLLLNDKAYLQGSTVTDKVIGKAAAALMILGGVKRIYADVISESALKILGEAGIRTEFFRKVPFIKNRDKTGWCPLEAACYGMERSGDIYPIIENFFHRMRVREMSVAV